jgi:hypothetical protein
VTDSGTSGEAAAPGRPATEPTSLWRFMLGHRHASLAVVVIVLLAAGLTVATTLTGSSASALTDATTCSAWTAATQAQRASYAHLYFDEHAAAPPATSTVTAAIDVACTQAAYLGESDDMSVVAAVKHEF